jgi:two-component system response regulator YcbB
MKFYILDDDINTCRRIIQIIEEEQLGNVISSSHDPIKSLDDFNYFDIDVMIIDLLMPGIDGIKFVRRAKEINNQVEFIMISQVNRKELISKAYDAGVKFFVNKPINRNEVVNVIRNISELVEYKRKFDFLSDVFKSVNHENFGVEKTFQENMKKVLIEIGIWGEKGTLEIINLAEYIKKNNIELADVSLRDVFKVLSDNPQNFEQRIRRAVNKGLSNLAYIGLEDNLNNTFIMYSNTLYDFESIQKEMEYLRGHVDRGGKVSLRKFIDTLLNL